MLVAPNLAAAIAGLLVHHTLFIRGEWHLQAPKVVIAHVIIGGVILLLLQRHEPSPILHQGYRCACMFASYFTPLFSSIVTYRLFFHRLRHFPGPRIAAATKLWHVLKSRGGTNFLVLDEMQHKYGPFVRTGKQSCLQSVFFLRPGERFGREAKDAAIRLT